MMFTVVWEIQVEAETAIEAARQALAIQRDPNSTATVFEVEEFRPLPTTVDLGEAG